MTPQAKGAIQAPPEWAKYAGKNRPCRRLETLDTRLQAPRSIRDIVRSPRPALTCGFGEWARRGVNPLRGSLAGGRGAEGSCCYPASPGHTKEGTRPAESTSHDAVQIPRNRASTFTKSPERRVAYCGAPEELGYARDTLSHAIARWVKTALELPARLSLLRAPRRSYPIWEKGNGEPQGRTEEPPF